MPLGLAIGLSLSTGGGRVAPPVLNIAGATFAQQNTTVTNALWDDGYTWAAMHPTAILVDREQCLIAYAEHTSSQYHTFVYSNDDGATWHDNPGITNNGQTNANEAGIDRGSMAYDPVHDLIWVYSAIGSDGTLIRRFAITRSGRAITSIDRVYDVNLVVDGSADCQHPHVHWAADLGTGSYGGLLITWGAPVSGGSELRAAMIDLQESPARANTGGNWHHLGVAGSPAGTAPSIASCSVLASVASAGTLYPVVSRMADGDLYAHWHTATAYQWRKLPWASATKDWASTWTTAAQLTLRTPSGSDGGYNQKQQLSTAFHRLGSDTYLALAIWKSNTDGDTVRLCRIDAAGTVTTADVYSAGGAHSYAPCCDLAIDSASQRLLVSTLATSTHAAELSQVKPDLTADGSRTLLFNSAPVDIPLILNRGEGSLTGNALLVMFRDTVNSPTPPYHGWFGRVPWV